VEDLLGAGAVVAGLDQEGVVGASPEAALAAAAYQATEPRLRETLLACTSGRELVGRGFADDVEVAAERDVSVHVPVLDGRCFRPRTGSNPPPTG
jgi:2-phosphosulfolactate phosphatase